MPWSRVKPSLDEPDFYSAVPGLQGRHLSWAESTREALSLALQTDPAVFVMGQGVDDPGGMFGATRGLHLEYGRERVFDTPLAETALTGIAVGAAQAGLRPVYFHNRPDFLYLALDQLANHAAKWSYMFAGQVPVPLVVWACIGRGWGPGAQHSQALQGLFTHIAGLKVVMPATCYDAKGLLLAAIKDPNPVIIIDHRFNFKFSGPVPAGLYSVPLSRGAIRRSGRDVTIVATSHLVWEAWQAAEELAVEGLEAEIIDPRTIKPLDEDLVLGSLARTGRLVVADTGWKTAGFAAEVAALAVEKGFKFLKAPVVRVTPPDTPTPSAHTMENTYYVGKMDILAAVRSQF